MTTHRMTAYGSGLHREKRERGLILIEIEIFMYDIEIISLILFYIRISI